MAHTHKASTKALLVEGGKLKRDIDHKQLRGPAKQMQFPHTEED